MIVFDTNIISTFRKLRGLDLFKELFPDKRVIITPEVYQELSRAKEIGYGFVDYALEFMEVVSESIAVCKRRSYV